MTLVSITLDEDEQELLLRTAGKYPDNGPWGSLAEKIRRVRDVSIFEHLPPPDPENGIGVLRGYAVEKILRDGGDRK